ncbi:hypothetical protein L1987_34969 [Smallanthus sonchifolius]|uniref:Uncharacterized protein n=1 Tax=Smallanthus sonchifolius TaxID=185202 RepID=A0ACB9HX17_9ASTR|nr:hypothetical protein L1987_34969 [Smallanthus sonchifolius]
MDPAIAQPTPTASAADDGAPKDPTIIVKGKRTKRQRPTHLSYSSTSYNAANSSPASYSDFPTTTTTAEDEDTANCLILLSKGHNISPRNNNNNNNNNMEEFFSGYKFNSKRYIQTSTDDSNGFTGIYVYECKTCSRTFPSFQALGGHRASHKKPRINESDKPKPPPAFFDEDEPSPPLNHRVSSPGTVKKPSSKLHECSICGAEFNSGQALGGHMRRHRNTAAVNTTNTTLSLIPYSAVTVGDRDNQKSRNDGLCLDLDLNLPAQPETTVPISDQDRHRESSFKQQPSVHLSAAPTLVDCYY